MAVLGAKVKLLTAGRPALTLEQRQLVLEQAAQGRPIHQTVVEAGTTVEGLYGELRRDPDFKAMWHDARDMGHELLADRLITVHDEIQDPGKAALASKNWQWLLKARKHRRYGNKLAVQVSGSVDFRPRIEEGSRRAVLLDALREQGLSAPEAVKQIGETIVEAVVEPVEDVEELEEDDPIFR